VANGTPITLATESPSITRATARPRCFGAAIEVATMLATPKYAPCGSPSRNLATSSI
jgi:hypothetical protein